MKRREDSGDEKKTDKDKNGRRTEEVPKKNAPSSPPETFQRLKRKQAYSDEEPEKAPGDAIDSRGYRTTKRRRQIAKPDSESSASSSSDSDNEGSDATSSDISSWSSWESDDESLREIPVDEPDNGDAERPTSEDVEKLKREESTVFADLNHFWTTQVAGRVRKEFGVSKIYREDSFSSPETLKKRCGEVERLMSLPCVLSVGFNKEDSKFIVTVSDRNKALELSENLASQSIDIVEVRSSHLM